MSRLSGLAASPPAAPSGSGSSTAATLARAPPASGSLMRASVASVLSGPHQASSVERSAPPSARPVAQRVNKR